MQKEKRQLIHQDVLANAEKIKNRRKLKKEFEMFQKHALKEYKK